MFSKKPETRSPQGTPKSVASSGSTFSVIGTDVVIKGDISASADLHVDGRIEGDIACSSLVQGEDSTIEGSITAETARLAGTVKGTTFAKSRHRVTKNPSASDMRSLMTHAMAAGARQSSR